MIVKELLDRLRSNLVPGGTEPQVRLQLGNLGFVPEEWVGPAIDQFERHIVLGEKLNPLEKLGAQLLLDSIYYDEIPKTAPKFYSEDDNLRNDYASYLEAGGPGEPMEFEEWRAMQ